MKLANRQSRSMAIFGIVMGVLFLGFAGVSYQAGSNFGAMTFGGMGMLFLAHGLVKLSTERFPTKINEGKAAQGVEERGDGEVSD